MSLTSQFLPIDSRTTCGTSSKVDQRSGAEKRIGMIAGWGRLPVLVAKSLRDQGKEIFCLGVRNHASPELACICNDFQWTGMACMGKQARYFRRHGINQATLAGKIFKQRIFDRFALVRHRPDWAFIRHFYSVFVSRSRDRRDDTLLLTVVRLFQSYGVTMVPATDFAPDLLIREGILSGKLNSVQENDIRFGWPIARQMGGMDIGQSIVVRNQTVLAVEAIEGTDECIRRAGENCKSGGFVVIKVAKPNQDMRFDVPTVGTQTLETIHAAGGQVLAIEAEKTIVLDRTELVSLASQLGIAVVAIAPNESG